MQLESLKVFCDIARCRSFSQAAAENDLTQSAASQIVLQLERRLGLQLVDRSTRPLQLTGAGQRYYEGCRGLVEQYLDLEASLRRSQDELEANVQVAAIYSVGLGDMGHFVERFHAAHPGVQVRVEYVHPDRVYDKVFDGTADFGLVSFPRKQRDLVVEPWREEPMVLACAPAHPLARLKAVRVGQVDELKFVAFDKGLVIRREVDRFLREHGVAVQVVMEFDNIENIKKALEVTPTVALLPEPTLRQEVDVGTLVAIPLTSGRLVRPLGIIRRRQHRLGKNAELFKRLLLEAQTAHEGPSCNGAGRGRNGTAHPARRKQ
jgi:DNA-binding transcriptional LysR family regulator